MFSAHHFFFFFLHSLLLRCVSTLPVSVIVCLVAFRFACCSTSSPFFLYLLPLLLPVFVKYHLPVFTSSFPSAVTIETLHPYQQGVFGCQAHWLSQERDTGEQVLPWHDSCADVAEEKGIYLAPEVSPPPPGSLAAPLRWWHVRPFCHRGLTAEAERKSSWEGFTSVIESSSPGRKLLRDAC